MLRSFSIEDFPTLNSFATPVCYPSLAQKVKKRSKHVQDISTFVQQLLKYKSTKTNNNSRTLNSNLSRTWHHTIANYSKAGTNPMVWHNWNKEQRVNTTASFRDLYFLLTRSATLVATMLQKWWEVRRRRFKIIEQYWTQYACDLRPNHPNPLHILHVVLGDHCTAANVAAGSWSFGRMDCEVRSGHPCGSGAMAAMDSNVGPEFQRWNRNWQHWILLCRLYCCSKIQVYSSHAHCKRAQAKQVLTRKHTAQRQIYLSTSKIHM